MRNHPIRKSLGLIVLYAVFIVGIFVIQFRSDSIIRKNIRAMRVTLAETENGQQTTLKNQLQLTYNGLLFSIDEVTPAIFTKTEETGSFKATLKGFSQPDENTFSFTFEEGMEINFSLKNENDADELIISAKLPEGVDTFHLKTGSVAGYTIEEEKAKQLILAGKEKAFALTAPKIEAGELIFMPNATLAKYATYELQERFTADQTLGIELASAQALQQSITALSSGIISEFTRSVQSNAGFAGTLSEQTAISYVAAMAKAGRYNEAMNTVPNAFTKGNMKTFRSSPYFGSMAAMAPSLTMQIELFDSMIDRALSTNSLDIFYTPGISQYITIQANRNRIRQLTAMPASMKELQLTVDTAAGILRTYAGLKKTKCPLAEDLVPVLDACAEKIIEACTLENERIMIAENNTPLTVLAAATAGDALMEYGKISGKTELASCGTLIVNSYVNDTRALDLRTMAELYPILVHDNTYYPHFVLLSSGETNVWAWTISKSITYKTDENRTVELDIDFPVGLSQYVFIAGINPFRQIQIYNMNFRTDPQFEIYNSSGYVYRTNSKILLLKSRHKKQHETIKLFYRDSAEGNL